MQATASRCQDLEASSESDIDQRVSVASDEEREEESRRKRGGTHTETHLFVLTTAERESDYLLFLSHLTSQSLTRQQSRKMRADKIRRERESITLSDFIRPFSYCSCATYTPT